MWYQLELDGCTAETAEQYVLELEEAGALSVTMSDKNDDPILEPELGTMPLWPEVMVYALFDDEQYAEQVKKLMTERHPGIQFQLQHVPDQDWERAWMDEYKPLCFSERLWVCPSWHEVPDPAAIHLILDPGLAFGTGTHSTTRLCLEWLAKNDVEGKSVIDYGCGSGILAIAALKLGAVHAQAVDIDEQALAATRSNAEINHIADEKLQLGQPESSKPGVDLLIANILLEPLMKLSGRFEELLAEKGELIVSGLLKEQVEELTRHYSERFTLVSTSFHEDWALCHFKK